MHPAATVIGAVTLGPHSSVWPGAVLRGDFGDIAIGERTAIQDGAVLHATAELATEIGNDCLIGHLAHLEGCRVDDRCLIGSGAIVLNGAQVHTEAVIAAGALVPPQRMVPTGHIAYGVPVSLRRAEGCADGVRAGAREYVEMALRYRNGLTRVG